MRNFDELIITLVVAGTIIVAIITMAVSSGREQQAISQKIYTECVADKQPDYFCRALSRSRGR